MDLYQIIVDAYPELVSAEKIGVFDPFANGTIRLRDDSDGFGVYLDAWNYSKPLPKGLTVGKPKA